MYWGKIIGALAGLAVPGTVLSKIVLAVIGFMLGDQFDRGFARRFDAFTRAGDNIGRLNDDFVKALFMTMGHLAKVDGRVTEDEIRAARSVMHRLGLGPAQVRHAIEWFTAGKQPGFQLIKTIRELRRVGARSPSHRVLFVRLLLEVVLAKDALHQKERSLIWQVCTELDIGRVEFAQLEAMIRAQKGFRRSPAGDADAARVQHAYRTLGLGSDASNTEIKTAYRRLMNKNHPDKLSGSNPDEAIIAEAQRRTREVRSAYELLKARREIR